MLKPDWPAFLLILPTHGATPAPVFPTHIQSRMVTHTHTHTHTHTPLPEPHLLLPSPQFLVSLTHADLLLQLLANLVDGLEVSRVEIVLCHRL